MPLHLTRRAGTALLAAWLTACAGEKDGAPTDGSTPDYDPEVELGTGELEFEPLADGDSIYVVFGPQGGYHVNGSLRARGIQAGNAEVLDDPSNPTTTFRCLRDGAQIDFGITFRQGLEPVAGEPGVFEVIGRRVILDIASDAELDGVEIVLQVEIEDIDGVVVTDERTLIGEPHPLND